MTSNQLQLQANVETARHNLRMEELDNYKTEVQERYNAQMASYQEQMVNLERSKLQLQDKWETGKLTNQQQYNQMWYSIQQEANSIHWGQLSATDWYNTKMVKIEGDRTKVQQDYNKYLRSNALVSNLLKYNEVTTKQYQAIMDNIYRKWDMDLRTIELGSTLKTDEVKRYNEALEATRAKTQAATEIPKTILGGVTGLLNSMINGAKVGASIYGALQ